MPECTRFTNDPSLLEGRAPDITTLTQTLASTPDVKKHPQRDNPQREVPRRDSPRYGGAKTGDETPSKTPERAPAQRLHHDEKDESWEEQVRVGGGLLPEEGLLEGEVRYGTSLGDGSSIGGMVDMPVVSEERYGLLVGRDKLSLRNVKPPASERTLSSSRISLITFPKSRSSAPTRSSRARPSQ
jgi:hypothetical protein